MLRVRGSHSPASRYKAFLPANQEWKIDNAAGYLQKSLISNLQFEILKSLAL